ncbi:MAG: NADP-dependent malic enzyme [Candidatus Komeilibacteria bacterium]|nr:NADP-dependent malic enzyme [Candidatus Komeilibacteria bacterium]
MPNKYKQSLALHKKYGGKLQIKSKVPIKSRRDLSLAYTPGVAEVSRAVAANAKLAKVYTLKKNSVAIVSDGSAVLGLGNIGPYGAIPVMEGKAVLFKEFANVDAWPICLDTQDMEGIIIAIKRIAPVFGGINLEDISAPRCFEIEKRLQKELTIPVLHDDQHGTGVVVLAALINALKIRRLDKNKARVVVNGAGAGGIGVTELLLAYGFKHITMCDSQGIIYQGRPSLNAAKINIAKRTNKNKEKGDLKDALRGADVFIGLSGPRLVTADMIRAMNQKPIIFAMANPEPEILPNLAKRAGAFIVATGRSDFPNQVNNVLAFPGIFRGALDNNVRQITAKMLIAAAQNLARLVKKPDQNNILPSPFDKRVAPAVARAIKAR